MGILTHCENFRSDFSQALLCFSSWEDSVGIRTVRPGYGRGTRVSQVGEFLLPIYLSKLTRYAMSPGGGQAWKEPEVERLGDLVGVAPGRFAGLRSWRGDAAGK